MMPEEWPIAAPIAERSAPARAAGRGRRSTVRADFFLDPAERLSEQERAVMTAMLHCLVGDIAAELRAALPTELIGANDEASDIAERLSRAGLLDRAELIVLLLRRADEDRIASAARARSGRSDARALQGLVSSGHGALSAAAMGLILARGRRRNRFGQCLMSFDDLSRDTAETLVHAVAAALRRELASLSADAELAKAAAQLLAKHDGNRRLWGLTSALARKLDEAGEAGDDFLLACAREGELALIAGVVACRSRIDSGTAFDELLSGNPRQLMALLRAAGSSRELAAGLLASLSDLIGIADPGAAMSCFAEIGDEEAEAYAASLAAAPAYREALEALGGPRG